MMSFELGEHQCPLFFFLTFAFLHNFPLEIIIPIFLFQCPTFSFLLFFPMSCLFSHLYYYHFHFTQTSFSLSISLLSLFPALFLLLSCLCFHSTVLALSAVSVYPDTYDINSYLLSIPLFLFRVLLYLFSQLYLLLSCLARNGVFRAIRREEKTPYVHSPLQHGCTSSLKIWIPKQCVYMSLYLSIVICFG